MPRGYTIYQFSQFPELLINREQVITRSRDLSIGDGSLETQPLTSITFNRRINELDLEVIDCKYERLVFTAGRIPGRIFQEYIQVVHFNLYYQRSNGIGLLRTAKDIAHSAMKEMNKSELIDATCRKIEVASVAETLNELKGAWVRNRAGTSVRSRAYFGDNIEQDSQYRQAVSTGDTLNIRFDYQFMDEILPLGISERSNIIVDGPAFEETLELQLVLEVKQNVLDPARDAPRR